MMPNGITHNTDKSQIYVVDVFAKSVSVFNRNAVSNVLTPLVEIKTRHGFDNIKFDDVT